MKTTPDGRETIGCSCVGLNSPETNGEQDLAEPCPGRSFHTFSSNLYYRLSLLTSPLPAAGLASSSLHGTCADHPPAQGPLACSEAILPPSSGQSSFYGSSIPPTSSERSPHSSQSPSLWIALLLHSVCWASFSSIP